MIRNLVWLLNIAVITLSALSALATCPTPPKGPYYFGGGPGWYEYTPDHNCVSATGSVAPTTLWCYNTPAWSIGSSLAVIRYAFVAEEEGLDDWDAEARIEFNDPNNSAGNWVEIWANVTHNGVTTSKLLYEFDGSKGDQSCRIRGGSFNALTGDTIEILIYARKASSNATIQISAPLIVAYY